MASASATQRCLAAALSALALTACSGLGTLGGAQSGAAAAGGSDGGTTYNGQIAPIVQARCLSCHVAGGIGPFPLDSYAAVVAHAADIVSVVQAGSMPPWPPAAGCQQYEFDLSMPAGEQQTLLTWLQGSMPQGSGPVASAAAPAIAASIRPDVTLTMPTAYRPHIQPDEYRCFLLPWPETTTKYMVGSDTTPGNPAIVHHSAVYIANQPASAFDEGADGFPGFTCTASPAGVSYTLTGWRPGSRADLYAADAQTGTRIDPNAVIVLQMHYHYEGDLTTVAPDQTQVVMQLADTVLHQGFPVVISDPVWTLAPSTMSIPAGDSNVVHSYTASPFFWWDYWTHGLPYTQLTAIEVSAHMHQLGTQVHITINRGGQSICLLDIPQWSFHWQSGYHMAPPVPLQAGDTVTLSCQWDNSAGNQPLVNGIKQQPATVQWGEDAADEMCVGSLYLAPP